ncbi:TIGR00730 family Rossman fold protein [Sporolactobacillus sp. CQH2019]|uniref:LOG family protein n=1 Tax=Sporolactobacillus sp. CQH2019 TaxID=3023512 RepID=UPI002367B225|nr:TIGR00730 family Rossman fold protein [Sporolactobacillus sp. CQH2019]MDD9149059.1 TIGR00730 family Rossman fold protein [Sporolactobacillus sp. CQH2019]
MKYIAVYCGASAGNSKIYANVARRLGTWLVQNRYGLVYGGGRVGLMGEIAKTVVDNKGYVWGIIPRFLAERKLAFTEVTKLEEVADMSERKARMLHIADCCIALPGGPGTLEEITEAFSWARLGKNASPCIFLNINGFYDPLKMMYQQMVGRGFLTEKDYKKLLFTENLDDINPFIENYSAPQIRQYK